MASNAAGCLLIGLTCLLGAAAAEDASAPATAVKKPAPKNAHQLSPEVHPDRSVTFRLAAPNAKLVELDATPPLQRTPMVKNEDGVWSVTIPPVEPGLYQYWFRVDGLAINDPENAMTKPALFPTKSLVEVPAETPAIQEWRDVPHGIVRLHDYTSKTMGRLRHLRVYTPPGYRDDGPPLPVLYLYPGSTNHEDSWMGEGRAHWIMDNLLAEKKCVPMLVVMPEIHALDPRVPAPPGKNDRDLVEQELTAEIVPMIDAAYRTQADRDHRALAGLSKGSYQAVSTGLLKRNMFAWVGGFSGAASEQLLQPALDDPKLNDEMKLVWIGVGKNDFTLKSVETLHELLDKRGIRHTYHLTEGIHEYTLWRPYLAEFVQLLFR
jgi:enterochelin esterase-like enzyme